MCRPQTYSWGLRPVGTLTREGLDVLQFRLINIGEQGGGGVIPGLITAYPNIAGSPLEIK